MNAWTDFWNNVSVLQLAGWILGMFAVGAFLYKAWPVITRFVTTINALGDLPRFMVATSATLHDQDEKIEQIHHEVNYNNGSSVKDAVRRVEDGVKGIYGRLDSADTDRAELREDLENTRPVARKRTPKPPIKPAP